MKRKSEYERFMSLTDEQKDKEVARFDREELNLQDLKPLRRADRQALDHAARRGRPKIGQGAQRVLVTIERGTLKKADATAKKLGISRSQLIARGLEVIMAKVA